MLKEKISIRIFEKLPFPPKKTSFPYCDFCKYRRYLYTYRRYLYIFSLKIKKYEEIVVGKGSFHAGLGSFSPV